MSQPVDLSPLQRELDNLRLQLCHCNNAGTCLGCQGVDMLRQQVTMVVSAASQPVLLQVAQETQAKELVKQVQEMQERLLRDPEAAKALEELLKYFQEPPEETNHKALAGIAVTTTRCVSTQFGQQVKRVSRTSLVGFRICTAVGATIVRAVTW